jgi:hypothetical protein
MEEGDNPMSPNMFLYEMARKAHYQDLRREITEQRLLTNLSQHNYSMSICSIDWLPVLRFQIGAWLKQLVQPHTTPEKRTD